METFFEYCYFSTGISAWGFLRRNHQRYDYSLKRCRWFGLVLFYNWGENFIAINFQRFCLQAAGDIWHLISTTGKIVIKGNYLLDWIEMEIFWQSPVMKFEELPCLNCFICINNWSIINMVSYVKFFLKQMVTVDVSLIWNLRLLSIFITSEMRLGGYNVFSLVWLKIFQ